ncbi:MAG: hypothetical protein J0L69_11900 [Bacteroidetes bacterium]|nr:hypothetical protein [Bacteroidota bacterium]
METKTDWIKSMDGDEANLIGFFYSKAGLYLLYSYSGIYLVIEGWKELKLSDEKIDKLISSPYLERLRRFRNATFHYQKEPLSMKHLDFFGTEEEKTEVWLNEVYNEFERYFMSIRMEMPEQLKIEIKEKNPTEVTQLIHKYFDNLKENKKE